jgi:hypothetical protein
MSKLRSLGLLALLCLLAISASPLAADSGSEPSPAAPAAVDQPLPWELTGGECTQAPATGTPGVVEPSNRMTCFCIEDRGYCRRWYGPQWYCNTEPCQCEHI